MEKLKYTDTCHWWLVPKKYTHAQTFMKYCRFGDRRNTGRMVVAKLTALCKDAGLVDKRFPMQRVEISFSRLKPKVGLLVLCPFSVLLR